MCPFDYGMETIQRQHGVGHEQTADITTTILRQAQDPVQEILVHLRGVRQTGQPFARRRGLPV